MQSELYSVLFACVLNERTYANVADSRKSALIVAQITLAAVLFLLISCGYSRL